jgi:hypothetical protein
MAGWCNLLGQIAGVASGGYSGAEVIGDISTLTSGVVFTPVQLLAVYALVLIFAGIINTFAEELLTRLCSISVVWHIVGVILIVALMVHFAPTLKSAEYVALHFNNGTPFTSPAYVVLTGSLAAASTFTGSLREVFTDVPFDILNEPFFMTPIYRLWHGGPCGGRDIQFSLFFSDCDDWFRHQLHDPRWITALRNYITCLAKIKEDNFLIQRYIDNRDTPDNRP